MDFAVTRYKSKRDRDLYTIKWTFQGLPCLVLGGAEDLVLRINKRLGLGERSYVYKLDTFFGFDIGDRGEMSAYIYDGESGRVLYQRSLHKETTGVWDAHYLVTMEALTSTLILHYTARCTDVAPSGDLRINADFNLVAWCGEGG